MVCAHIILKCLHLVTIGRPDLLWSVKTLARTVTKWIKACEKRLPRLSNKPKITGISGRCESKLKIANLVYSKMLHLQASGGLLSVFGSHTFVPISWMCKKQAAVFAALRSLKLFRLTKVSVGGWFNSSSILLSACLKQCSVKLSWNFECYKRDKVIPSHSHSDNYVFATFRPTFPTAPTQLNSTYSKTVRQ